MGGVPGRADDTAACQSQEPEDKTQHEGRRPDGSQFVVSPSDRWTPNRRTGRQHWFQRPEQGRRFFPVPPVVFDDRSLKRCQVHKVTRFWMGAGESAAMFCSCCSSINALCYRIARDGLADG